MLTPAILLQFSSIQNFVVDTLTRELSKRYNTRVSIGTVDYRFFNSFRMNQLLIEDQTGDTLLHAGAIDAEFEFWQLFRNKISVSSLNFDQVFVNLEKEANGVMNFDFIMNRDTVKKDSSFFDVNINKLTIRNSKAYYTNHSRQREFNAFNPDKIRISDINSEISIATFNRDSIDITVKSLSAGEQSGLELVQLTFSATGSHRGVEISNLDVVLPESKLFVKKIDLKASSLQDILAFRPSLSIVVPLRDAKIALHDLKAFVPGFGGSSEKIRLNALISGRLSNLKAQELEINYGSTVRMKASVEINGLPDIEESFIYAKVDQLQANHSEVQDLVSRIQNRPFILPEEMRRLGLLSYQGNITGFLSDLVAFGIVRTNLGTISSDISLRFENHLRDLFYNGTLRTSNFELGRFLNSSRLGSVRMMMNTKGSKRGDQALKGTITASVDQLNFNQYSYSNANLKGEYDGSGFNGNIQVKDENIDADFTGILDFRNPRLPVFNFDLVVNNTNLHALKMINQYPDSRLSFHGTTNLTGNTLDNLNGNLQN